MTRLGIAIVLVAAPAVAAAQAADDHSAADVASAPLPGDESGRIDRQPGDSALRELARGALFVPKLLTDATLEPLRGAVWVEDHYQLEDLYYRTFFNRDRTFGIFPSGTYETGYGGTIGAELVHHDLLGHHEHLELLATTGAAFGELYRADTLAAFDTGDRFGRWQFGIEGNFNRRPGDPFYGIGNGNLRSTAPDMPIDPRVDPTAVSVTYKYQEARTSAYADVRPFGAFHVRTTGELTDLEFGRGETGPAIDEVYAPMGLVGFGGVRHLYGELELRYDRRHRGSIYDPAGLRSEGLLAVSYLGRVHELEDYPDFWHYGGQVQQLWRLGNGPQTLATRLYVEAVSGSRDQVPFAELPELGGGELLRGYDFARFRDRVAAYGSVEYGWGLSDAFDAALFVDAGRVYPSLDDLTLDDLRVGYGLALDFYQGSGFAAEGTVATSIDGGIFFSLSFNPVWDARPRWR
ncbi:MAG TPA: BamA/TamA family outer membrane protein [Kofleriaceae bacterium]|nr:BamA/TamA family outer membrane protein [Kofleriaceae bacterium]